MWRIPIEDVCQICHLEGERAVVPLSFKTISILLKSCRNSLWDKHSSRSVSSFWKFSFIRGLLLVNCLYTLVGLWRAHINIDQRWIAVTHQIIKLGIYSKQILAIMRNSQRVFLPRSLGGNTTYFWIVHKLIDSYFSCWNQLWNGENRHMLFLLDPFLASRNCSIGVEFGELLSIFRYSDLSPRSCCKKRRSHGLFVFAKWLHRTAMWSSFSM